MTAVYLSSANVVILIFFQWQRSSHKLFVFFCLYHFIRFPYLCATVAKVFVILLTIIYACSVTGATVHLHYCCGELQKLMTHADDKANHEDCSLCRTHHEKEQEKGKGCCTDDRCGSAEDAAHGHCQNVKVEAKKTTEEHLPSADKKLAKIYPLELLVFTLAYVIDLPLDTHSTVRTADGAPPNVTVPLFIQHCTYRI